MIWFGGDYNPEQWDESVWDDDIRLMAEAHVSMVTVGVFSWSMLEPSEGNFTFEWLDRILDKLHAAGIRVDLATATASPPPWLTHNYPEVLPMTEQGVRLQAGSRQQYCPSSPVFRRLATRLASEIAQRYAGHPALEMWHINNEYGCHLSHCYCDVSAVAFRQWLAIKYATVDHLNEAWGTAFWSQRYGSFEEIHTPSAAPYFKNPGQVLDFDRFSSDELLECFRSEAQAVRAISPGVPLTTNFMGFFKPVDYWKWAAEIDVISDDSYPDPADPDSPMIAAMSRDLMRSLGSGKPWILMEQAASAVNWRDVNAAKPEGMMRAWSYQAIARGADGVLFFQWRQSVRGGERFHSAMLPHTGTDTASWRSITQLGRELVDMPASGDRISPASTAIMFDWDTWWSIEQPGLPATLSYLELVRGWYRPLYEAGVAVDFVNPASDLAAYKVVIVPSLFAAAASSIETLAAFGESGGTLLVTFQTAITDESGQLTPGGYLGSLATTLGVRIDEFFPQPHRHEVQMNGPLGRGVGTVWAERLISHDAEVMAHFTGGPLQGCPAVTRKSWGAGASWYVATEPDDRSRKAIIEQVLSDGKVEESGVVAPAGVEVAVRGGRRFIINHTDREQSFEVHTGHGADAPQKHSLGAYGVTVLAEQGALVL
ncbi:beta-galactosidase [Salinibacterium sp. CAN_S4]|uniref:beta-galactosidase n=1 Tax=Salinibacterium sp. CAN_S4 TaxID=2787727 RepID=UPI001A312A9E